VLTGSGFAGTTAVSFNATAAVTFTVNSNTQITATVSAGATRGTISVTNAAGTGVSTTNYTVTVAAPVTFTPIADAQVKSKNATTNYGSLTSLRIREGNASNNVTYHSFVKFNMTGLSGTVTSAKLRLFVTTTSTDSAIVQTSASTWVETTLNWNNRPLPGATLGSVVPGTANAWVEIPLTASAFSAGNGTYSLMVRSSGTSSAVFQSREAANDPQLVLETSVQASLTAESPVRYAINDAQQRMYTGATGRASRHEVFDRRTVENVPQVQSQARRASKVLPTRTALLATGPSSETRTALLPANMAIANRQQMRIPEPTKHA